MAMFGASRVVSKYKNAYCDQPSADKTYSNLRVGTQSGDFFQANPKYFVYSAQGGGGPFVVQSMESGACRLEADVPTVNGHTGACLSFDWNPFNDNQLASCSDDCTIKLWTVPDGGFKANHTAFDQDLSGHMRKVTHVKFNPTAANSLISAGAEHSVKLWDVEKGVCAVSNDETHPDLILDLAWDYYGNQYATTCKDKTVRICDARSGGLTHQIPTAHDGTKSAKCTFLGAGGNLLSVGFSRTSMRHFKIWDPRDVSKPVVTKDIDQAAGVMMPFYDNDTGMLFLAGKGDGTLHYYDLPGTAPWVVALNTYRSTVSATSMAFMPKRGLNVSKNEIARLLKLTASTMEPLSFVVPRKTDAFQPDLYPDTAAPEASHSFDEWMGGSNKGPRVFSMNPSSDGKIKDSAVSAAVPVGELKAPVTIASLTKELDRANARIADLEARCKAAGIEV